MTQPQLIQQVRLVDPVTAVDQVRDVLVERGRIQAVEPTLTTIPDQVEVIDGSALVLLPGLVDLYSHAREPGQESLETLAALLQAAQAGGITRLGILPTTIPAIDHPAMVAQLLDQRQSTVKRLANPALPHLYPWGALTQGAQGKQMTELAELATTGIVGFSDGQPLSHPLLLRHMLDYVQPLGKPVGLWACDRSLQSAGVAREGSFALIYGLLGDPNTSETTALAALLEAVAKTPTPVHLMRLSTARGVELVRQAKDRHLPVTASTTWMHLLFSTRDLHAYDPNLRLDPPLGNPEDQAALIFGVESGVIDAIAIDHAPHSYEDKTVGFAAAPPGAIGLELALPLLWQTFVASGQWSALTLMQSLSTAPARCWQQSPPTLQTGHPAEMVLFDPAASWSVSPTSLKSDSTNTPWLGRTISGQVNRSWVPLEPPS